jgi:DNA-binding response OmpR family regulator
MTRILVIDDDDSVSIAIKLVLVREGFDVITVPGGKGGLQAVELYAFDLVIVDMVMPDIDGLETIRLLHEIAPKVPVIAVSGYMFTPSTAATSDFLGVADRFGITYCLHKPFRPEELLVAVSACVSGTGLRAQPGLRA